jgi:two-component system, LytTR family, response regulator LytT
MKIIIIEDEKLTANHLAKTIRATEPDAEIVGMLHSVEEAIDFFKKPTAVDLIFSDIELGDGLSFEIFEQWQFSTPIIFCTAYNQYALEAFKTTGIDYILKPFDQKAIEKTLLKFQNLKSNIASETTTDTYASLLGMLRHRLTHQVPSVLIHQGEKVIPLSSKNIALFFVEDDYTFAYTFEGRKHILSQNMEVLERTFPDFFRANRQFLVNRAAVRDASHYFHRKMLINLTIPFSEPIVVSKLKVTSFMGWLVGA